MLQNLQMLLRAIYKSSLQHVAYLDRLILLWNVYSDALINQQDWKSAYWQHNQFNEMDNGFLADFWRTVK